MQAIQNKIIKKSTLYIIYGVFIALFGTIVFNYNAVFADTSVNYNVQIEQALNVTVSSNTISLDLNPESKQFGTEDLSVSVGTNYINGYKLYIRSDSTNLTNSTVSSTIPTLASTTPASSFPANYWGYRISSGSTGDSSITDEDYHEFTSGTLVSSSSTAVDSNTSVLTFAAKADYDKPAGTYANTFTFNAVANPVTYSITYADNTGDTISNLPTPNPQTGMVTSGSATISSTIPTRDGYTFEGWCKGTVSDSGTTCTGTQYSAGDEISFSSEAGPDVAITLYATWENLLYMQDVVASDCTADYRTVYDNRDGQSYVIQRLDDGNCWMMTNLNLGAVALNENTDLTSSNTNLSTTVTASTFNGWKKTSGSATYTAGEYIVQTDADSNNNLPYGALYNYYAASAGTISGSSNSNNASYDICPKGWRLPTGGSSGEFQTLYGLSAYNTNAKMRASYESGGAAFTLAGFFNNSTPTGQGGNGSYWSSSQLGDTSMYRLYLGTSNVTPVGSSYRNSGGSIRCVLKTSINDISTMQEFGSLTDSEKTSVLASMTTGTAYTLTDTRDDQSYVVSKLADGKVWMMTNLNLGAVALNENTDLTSDNTNLITTITASAFAGWERTDSTSASYTVPYFDPVSGTDTNNGLPYGTLYNYCAATANTYCYSSSSSSGNAQYDLCPAGWRLPTGGSSGEFQTLYNNYNSNALMRASYENNGAAFALAGYFDNGAPTNQGSSGFYWSSSRGSNTNMYDLYLETSYVTPASSGGRYGGGSIRCVLK